MTLKRRLGSLCPILLLFLMQGFNSFSQKYPQKEASDAAKTFFMDHKQAFGLNDQDIQFIVTRDYRDESIDIRHIYLQQQRNGLDLVNGSASLHLRGDGTVMHYENQLFHPATEPAAVAGIDALTAVKKSMTSVGMAEPAGIPVKAAAQGISDLTVFRAAGTSWDIPARKVYITDRANQLRLAWEVQLFRRDKDNYWIIYVDATNSNILATQDMVVKCNFGGSLVTDEPGEIVNHQSHQHYLEPTPIRQGQSGAAVPGNSLLQTLNTKSNEGNRTLVGITNTYRVYDSAHESPLSPGASHALAAKAGDPLASPDGWHKVANGTAFPYTRGNNVWAFQDPSPGPLGGVPSDLPDRTSYNNGGPLGAPVATEPFLFDYAADLNGPPPPYMKAAIVNLFYWNNLMHDVFYLYGFTEAAGNFQQSHDFSTGTNRGNKPSGQNDHVLAQAQDGGGTNNANMLTLADGTNGQMQMYLWNGAPPDSIVQIRSSTGNNPPAGTKYFSIQGSFGNPATSNTNLFTNPILNKPFIIIQKNALGVGTETQGCGTGQQSVGLAPANDVNGKIVLIDRGTCSFVEKMNSAQMGGAAGVIIINNVPGPPIAMGGSDAPNNTVTIPGVMISLEDGKILKARLAAGASITGDLKKNINAPQRDGDFDNGVIAHEYGHGISTRLTAGGPNPTSRLGGDEQGGEGWSDNFALFMTTRKKDLLPPTTEHPNGILPTRGIGNYVTYQAIDGRGIRPTPYSIDLSVNPSTYKRVGEGGEITIPHGVGYIWCSMLYEMQQELIDQYGFNDKIDNATPVAGNVPTGAGGNNVAMRLVMEGLKLQPASPTFVQERDAILKADTILYGGQHACRLWRAFAKRGLGFSATSGTNAAGDEVEQFNTHPLCNPQTVLSITHTGPSLILNQSQQMFTIKVVNKTPIALNATSLAVTDTLPAFTTLVSAPGATLTGNVLSWPLTTLAKGDTATYNVTVNVTHPNPATLIFNENNENTPATNSFQSMPLGVGQWNLISTGAFSGTKTWFIQDYDLGGSHAALQQKTAIVIPAGSFLIFNHKYATEATYDGGVVEYSVDGVNWVYLNTFIKNGYNATITTTKNPHIGAANLAAFTGASPGYVQSIANLSSLSGQSVLFRFRFTSDEAGGSVTGGGWWVDDVQIASPASFITAKAAAVASNSASTVRAEADALVITLGPLPVTGVDLKALVRNKQIMLNWETQSEIDNRGFEVLRKAANESSYSVLGFVNGAGNSSTVRSYSFTDPSAVAGIRYEYKLRLVGLDNTSRFSNIASAMILGKLFAFSFAPNPATDHVTITVNNESKNSMELRITDITGKVMRRENLGNSSYLNEQINLSGMAKGMYILELSNGVEKQKEKLIVQ